MATPAQIAANRANSKSATGPRTPEGKARSARNAVKLGLFSLQDLVRPEQEAEYQQLSTAIWESLAPEDPLQQSLAIEIIRATWRLQRCAHVEAGLLDSLLETGLDPMQNEATLRTQNAVDRARAQSNTIIRRATADLRRLQTDRQVARETLPGKDTSSLGLVSMQEVWRTLYQKIKTKELYDAAHAESAAARESEIAAREVSQVTARLRAQHLAKQTQPGLAG